MKPVISVIICTHNPRPDYLYKVMEALKSQTLSMEQWEILLIDNASSKLLSSEVELNWHLNARHTREEQLGLTHARLRGIHEAKAEILVFVDDDNVLEKDYLEIALNISKNWPMLGAWGGQTISHFDEPPLAWTQPFWIVLGIREFDYDKWSNLMLWETTPIGAGMCVRRIVAEQYASLVRNDPRRSNLGRKGNFLVGCEDLDMAYTSCDLGLGTGLFASLKLLHLMPASRLEEKYLLRIVEGTEYSVLMLHSFRNKFSKKLSWKQRLELSMPWLINLKMCSSSSREHKFYQARTRGKLLAMKEILASRTQFC